MMLEPKEVARFMAEKVRWEDRTEPRKLEIEPIKTGRAELLRALRRLLPSLSVHELDSGKVLLTVNAEDLAKYQQIGPSRMEEAKARQAEEEAARGRRHTARLRKSEGLPSQDR